VTQVPDTVLLRCLDQLAEGQPIDVILQRHPEFTVELRPILESALRLTRLPVDPPPAVRQRAKIEFVAQANQVSITRGRPALSPRRLVGAFTLLLLFFVVAGATMVSVSAAVLPGSALYGTKRTIEQWQLRLTADPEAKTRLTISFRQERLDEVSQLLRTGRSARVVFQGTIDSMEKSRWVIAGLPVTVDATTVIAGKADIGAEVKVTGQTQKGRLSAISIDVLSEAMKPPTPTITPTNTPTPPPPTATPTNTPTLTPTSEAIDDDDLDDDLNDDDDDDRDDDLDDDDDD
jgi:hypothetical protein